MLEEDDGVCPAADEELVARVGLHVDGPDGAQGLQAGVGLRVGAAVAGGLGRGAVIIFKGAGALRIHACT